MEENFALIIGINDYTPPNLYGLKGLGGAINDADHFAAWVTDPKGGNVPIANCKKITSVSNPLLKPIQQEIDDKYIEIDTLISEKGGSANRFYFYFAGHGVGLMNQSHEIALCLPNWSEKRRHDALGAKLYEDAFAGYGYFKEIILILDCCRNTKINIVPSHPKFGNVTNKGKNVKRFVAYATQYQDQAAEIEVGNAETRGVFTKVLIDGLNGAAADENGIVNADSLREYLIKVTPVEAQKAGFKQIPEIINSFTAANPIVKVKEVQNAKIECSIIFSDLRTGKVELVDGNLSVIQIYDAGQEKTVEVSLSKGLYLLRDTITGEMLPVQVSPVNKIIHVNF